MRHSKTFRKVIPIVTRLDDGFKSPDDKGDLLTKEQTIQTSDEKEALIPEFRLSRKISVVYTGRLSLREFTITDFEKKRDEKLPNMIKRDMRKENQKQYLKQYTKNSEREEFYTSDLINKLYENIILLFFSSIFYW